MATLIGRLADLAISTDGVSYTEIGKIKDVSPSQSADLADETNNDSNGWKESQYADRQLTLDVSFVYDDADAGQTMLFDAYYASTTYYFRGRPEAAVGEKEFIFQANISDLSLSAATGEVQTGSASIESTGAVTKQDQT